MTKTRNTHAHTASHAVTVMVRRMQDTFASFTAGLTDCRPNTAGGVALQYLRRSDVPRLLDALRALPPRVHVADDRQQVRLDGTLKRAEKALRFVETPGGDAFEKAQVLEDAIRDFGLRLSERGLLLGALGPTAVPKYEDDGAQQSPVGGVPSYATAA